MRCFFRVTTEPFLFLQSGIYVNNILLLPQLLQDRVCRNLYNSTVCNTLLTNKRTFDENYVQEIASFWLSILSSCPLLVTLISICFVGPLADTIGKKNVMIAFPISTLIQAILYIVLINYGHFHPAWLLCPILTPALIGDFFGSFCLSLAYKCDITTTSERTRAIARMEGFFYFGVAILSILSGVLLKAYGYTASYMMNVFMSITNLVYVIAILPGEKSSLAEEEISFLNGDEIKEERVNDDENSEKSTKENPITTIMQFQQMRKVLRTMSDGHGIYIYLILLSAALIPIQGVPSVDILFFSHSPLNIRKDTLGYLYACANIMASFGAWFVLPLLQRFAGFEDFDFLIVGFLSAIVISVLFATAVKQWMTFAYSLLGMFAILPLGVSRSLITKHVSDDLHGTALTLAELVDAATSLLVNLLGNLIYAATVAVYPATVMFVLGFAGVIGLLGTFTWQYWKRQHYLTLAREG